MNISGVPELSERLKKALDSEFNVIDLAAVYDVISKLEGTNVTRELLETTRMAKFVNELRRKTPDAELARRSKSLLKRWREMVIPVAGSKEAAPQKARPGRPSQNGTLAKAHLSNTLNSSSKISPSKQGLKIPGAGHHMYNNNNSLRVANAVPQVSSSSMEPMEIINLTDDSSNSPSFQSVMGGRRQGKRAHSPYLRPEENMLTMTTTSANRRPMSGPSLSPSGMHQLESNTSTCDNNDSNLSRKHKKHKKERKSKQSTYNHVDERSAPNALLEDSLTSSLPNHHLILPDNDSLSNTSASIFNAASLNSTSSVPANLTFTGRFGRSEGIVVVDDEPVVSSSALVPDLGSVLVSRSASPHTFLSNNSNLSEHEGIIVAAVAAPPNHLVAATVEPPVKVPKKKGRKKGSKGIDSLLASQNSKGSLASLWNPDSYQDLKQKITSISGPKKNKTAQELLAEIQNKRPNSGTPSAVTSPSVTQAPSPSSLSDKSHQSQSTEVGSLSAAVSPEPPALPTFGSKVLAKESTTAAAIPTTVKQEEKPSTSVAAVAKAPVYEDIELTIRRLQSQLPPIKFNKTEEEEDEGPKCTCTFREVTEESPGSPSAQTASQSAATIEVNIVKDSDEEMAELQMRERLKARKRKKREKIVSIFDLVDDNDGASGSSDDDLESVPDAKEDVMRVLVAHELPPAPPVAASAIPAFPEPGDFVPEMPKLTTYEAVVDPDCSALEYFETNRNEVTNFHIRALHTHFIPCVNGNWSLRNEEETKAEPADATTDEVSVETANRVVPRYNFLTCDKIPKQFPDEPPSRVVGAKRALFGDVMEVTSSDSEDEGPVLLGEENNGKLGSFNDLNSGNVSGTSAEGGAEFREWYETVRVESNENENLTVLPYVVID